MTEATIEPSVKEVMRDTSASQWLKSALHSALERDPMDALNDALILASVLEQRLREEFGL